MQYCNVCKCKSNLKMFSLPNPNVGGRQAVLDQWLAFINNPRFCNLSYDVLKKKSIKVCQLHFQDDDFNHFSRTSLKWSSVPSIYPLKHTPAESIETGVTIEQVATTSKDITHNGTGMEKLQEPHESIETGVIIQQEATTSKEIITETGTGMERIEERGRRNLCRICLHYNSNCKSIFDEHCYSEGSISITEFIYRLTNLKFEKGDGFPEYLCTLCIEKVTEAHKFSVMVINSYTKFRKEWSEVNINLETLDSSRQQFEDKARKHTAENIEEELVLTSTIQDIDFSDNYENLEIIYESSNVISVDSNKDCVKDNSEIEVLNDSENESGRCEIKTVNIDKIVSHPANQNVNYKCCQCNKQFSKKTHLTIHSRSHVKTKEKPFVCEKCRKSFSNLYLLKQHHFKHSENKPFPCSQCSKGFLKKGSLRWHMRTHDLEYVKKKFICEICGKEFPSSSALTEHMKHHTDERPFLCSVCGKGFRQNGGLLYHMRSHTGYKPYTCQICNNKFISKGLLRVHMRTHTNERPYVCDICGMAFKQSTERRSHHRRIHTGDKPVLCTICGKRMSSTGQLKIHLRKHTGEKPYSCKICSKAFSTKMNLVRHERIHTGERSYICNICGRAFNQSSSLKTHALKIHKVQKTKISKGGTNKMVVVDNKLVVNIENPVVNVVNEIHIGSLVGEQVNQNQTYSVLPPPVPLLQNL